MCVTSLHPHPQYDWYWPQTFADGLRAEGESDVITLSRAGYAGSWRFGAAVWSGDTGSDFATLRFLVRAGVSAQISGVAWWTTDIGGYTTRGNHSDPKYPECIVRW